MCVFLMIMVGYNGIKFVHKIQPLTKQRYLLTMTMAARFFKKERIEQQENTGENLKCPGVAPGHMYLDELKHANQYNSQY